MTADRTLTPGARSAAPNVKGGTPMTGRGRGPRRLLWHGLARIVAVAAVLVGAPAVPTYATGPLPDPARSLSLHLHLMADGGSGAEPVAGVGFTIQRIQEVDLNTPAGWNQAAGFATGLTPDTNDEALAAVAGAGYSLGEARSGHTDADGTLVFAALPTGLYLVQQTGSSSAGVIRPGLVTLPLADPDHPGTWLYDVDVYPKMVTADITVTVEDAMAVGPQDIVTWTISAVIPQAGIGEAGLDGCMVTSRIDPRLRVTRVSVALDDGTELAPDTYQLEGPDLTDGLLTVEFTPAGLDVLAAHPGSRVITTVDTQIAGVGAIAFSALLYPDAASFDLEPGEPGGPVESDAVATMWGSLTIAKTDPSGNPLSGAVFSVYRSEEDARADRDPVALGGATRLTVDASGLLTLSPLRETDWAEGGPVQDGNYFLAEIVAPNGFRLLGDPIAFHVHDLSTADGVQLSVVNQPRSFWDAATGGSVSGGSLVVVAGILLWMGLVLIVVRRLKRRGEP